MDTKQQKETLTYFKNFAKDWKEKATGQKLFKVNVINQRNGFVLEVIKSRPSNTTTLDVGCGTGELVHETAKLNIHAIGVDFSSEMIELAKETATKENINNTEFVCASIYDYVIDNGSVDVISANGFLEYISYEQFDQFLTKSYEMLKNDGALVLGSRNRLYNIFSLNEYTLNEITSNNIEGLYQEAICLSTLTHPSELLKIKAVPLESPDAKHGYTGIDVSTRFQFTPAQLVQMLDAKGFKVEALCPVHIHGTSPAYASSHKEIHYNISNLLSQVSNEEKESRYKLIPNASSFMIHAVKK